MKIVPNQKGQIILIVLLVMMVGLAVGLSVIQRSLTDISTSSTVEQSSRAFSAAEAGVEQVLRGGTGTVSFPGNASSATVNTSALLPIVPPAGAGRRQEALEYPPLAKEEVAHVWLAQYTSTTNPPPAHYKGTSVDVYWGSSSTDKAAIELTLIYYTGTQYSSIKKFYDPDTVRAAGNGFASITCVNNAVDTILGTGRIFYCKQTVLISEFGSPNVPMLVRARLLYNNSPQPFALRGVGTCGPDCSFPSQAKIIISTGVAGETQRKVQLFKLDNVVLPYFDYAIFSAGEISK